jgi:hypothetical protein
MDQRTSFGSKEVGDFAQLYKIKLHYYTRTFHSHVVTPSQSSFGLGGKLAAVIVIAINVAI